MKTSNKIMVRIAYQDWQGNGLVYYGTDRYIRYKAISWLVTKLYKLDVWLSTSKEDRDYVEQKRLAEEGFKRIGTYIDKIQDADIKIDKELLN